MKRQKRLYYAILWVLLLALAALMAGSRPAAAAPLQTIDWFVMSGSGYSAAAGIYTLDGTIGQSYVGIASSDLCFGFWCGFGQLLNLYLPLIMR